MTQVKSSGHNYAAQIVKKLAADDVLSIAESVGVKIVYEKWFPITYGEFDKKKKTISVNLCAGESQIKIIAHELGHFFAQEMNLSEIEEEVFAHGFADYLTKDKK
jgi:Zn-dependent peptidase ImmA (M78 family)